MDLVANMPTRKNTINAKEPPPTRVLIRWIYQSDEGMPHARSPYCLTMDMRMTTISWKLRFNRERVIGCPVSVVHHLQIKRKGLAKCPGLFTGRNRREWT